MALTIQRNTGGGFNPFARRQANTQRGIAQMPLPGGVPSSSNSSEYSTASKTGRQAVNKSSILAGLMHQQYRPGPEFQGDAQQANDFADALASQAAAGVSLEAEQRNAQQQASQEQARQQAIQQNMQNNTQQFQSQVRQATNQQSLLANLKQHQQNQYWNKRQFVFDNFLD